jgi:hypothetical protein
MWTTLAAASVLLSTFVGARPVDHGPEVAQAVPGATCVEHGSPTAAYDAVMAIALEGRLAEAEAAARALVSDQWGGTALARIAGLWAESGESDRALAMLEQLSGPGRVNALAAGFVAMGLARSGEHGLARDVVRRIPDGWARRDALEDLARVEVRLGRTRDAIELLDLLEDALLRADVAGEIAAALAEAGEMRAALRVVDGLLAGSDRDEHLGRLAWEAALGGHPWAALAAAAEIADDGEADRAVESAARAAAATGQYGDAYHLMDGVQGSAGISALAEELANAQAREGDASGAAHAVVSILPRVDADAALRRVCERRVGAGDVASADVLARAVQDVGVRARALLVVAGGHRCAADLVTAEMILDEAAEDLVAALDAAGGSCAEAPFQAFVALIEAESEWGLGNAARDHALALRGPCARALAELEP